MKFTVNGQFIRESTGTRNKALAETIMRNRRREIEEGVAGVKRPPKAQSFAAAAKLHVSIKTPGWSPDTLTFNLNNLKHLLPVFGEMFVANIEALDISEYQAARKTAGAENRTVNMEVGTLRAILKRTGHWARLLPDVTMLKVRQSKGKVLPKNVADAVFAACKKSRSRALYPMKFLTAATGTRSGPVKHLKWENIDFFGPCLKWTKDKTQSGEDRIVPLSQPAVDCLLEWARNFPNRKPEHYVFPFERYGLKGHKFGKGSEVVIYETDPTKPMGSTKTAWTNARIEAHRVLTGNPNETKPVPFRTHDYRHTAFTQMRNKKVPLEKIGKILGWSPSMLVRMASIYGHYTTDDLREGVDAIGY